MGLFVLPKQDLGQEFLVANLALALTAVSNVPPPFFVVFNDFTALTAEVLYLSSVIDLVSSLNVFLN